MLTALLAFLGLAATTPASAATGSDLRVSVEFPAGPLVLGDRFKVTVEVTNVGDAPAVGARGDMGGVSGTDVGLTLSQWGDLDPTLPEGATSAPGDSRHLTFDAMFFDWNGPPVYRIGVRNDADANQDDNSVTTAVDVISPDVKEDVGGQVFADADGDEHPGAGDALAGVKVSLRDTDRFDLVFSATTGPDGTFRIPAVPAHVYRLDFAGVPGGWVLPAHDVRVDGSGSSSALMLAGARPLAESLDLRIAFDKPSYHIGDQAKATVTVHNGGQYAAAGLLIDCDPFGGSNDVPIPDSEWGDFSFGSPGASVAPGETKTIAVSGTVPEEASYYGLTSLSCYLYTLAGGQTPTVGAESSVPARSTDWPGIAYFDRNHNGYRDTGEEVGHVQIALTRPGTTQLRLASTDASGGVTFAALPAGKYRVSALGAWKIAPDFGETWVVVPPYGLGTWEFQVVPK
ncbi:carboxypeptidase-like regulatory domain-containing protein [Amycolatopsis sp. NPDC050768]|uniref:carboxypeptidase-like regulatory domain-containing protein n=1 Tax=Amycolatopsis sp. NPDC050768 TaxID=3154839 RepID=UPI00340033C3